MKRSIPLNNIYVASPCSADWSNMTGNDQVRFCGQCNLNVYNLSGMTRAQAEDLIRQKEGKLCVRYYRRADGTILTQNCPVGLQAIKRRMSRIATAVASAVLSFLAGFGVHSFFNSSPTITMGQSVMGEMAAPVKPVEPVPKQEPLRWEMGDMVAAPAKPEVKSCELKAPVEVKMGRIALPANKN